MSKKNTAVESDPNIESQPAAAETAAPPEVPAPGAEAAGGPTFTYGPIAALNEVLSFLREVQSTPESCKYNDRAINHTEMAIGWIERSQAHRAAQAQAAAQV